MATKTQKTKQQLINFDYLVENGYSRELFNVFPEALMLINSKGIITDVNNTCNEWIGYGAEDLVGTHVSKIPFLSNKGKLKALAQFTKRIRGGEVPPYELDVISRDNTPKRALIKATVIHDKENHALIDFVTVTDLTKVKEAQTALEKQTKETKRLNKLMMGRELKMYELKTALKSGSSDTVFNRLESNDPFVEKNMFDMVGSPAQTENITLKKVFSRLFFIILTNIRFQIIFGVIFGVIGTFVTLVFLYSGWQLAFIVAVFSALLFSTILLTLIAIQKKVQNTYSTNTSKVLLNLLEDMAEENEYEKIRGKSVLENIAESIVITDETGKITYVNPHFENIFDRSNAEIVGLDFAEEIAIYDTSGKLLPVHERSDSAAITSNNQKMKAMMDVKDDKKIAVEIHAAPIRVHGQYHGVVRIIHDVTADYLLQQQKDDFFSIASHELRTPLTVIAGNIDMILEGYGKSKLSDSDTELLTDVSKASERLISMVNDFLNVSRLDQGRISTDIKEMNSCEVAEAVVKELAPLAKEKNITLEYTCPADEITVMADLGLFKEIIINLVGNSIKFTEQGSITVQQSVEEDKLVTRVIDTGMGIVKEKQDKLFNRFEQAHERTLSREAGGTGLGLYISREFARLMGGDLILEKSVKGKGSVFMFTLPIAEKKSDTKKTHEE